MPGPLAGIRVVYELRRLVGAAVPDMEFEAHIQDAPRHRQANDAQARVADTADGLWILRVIHGQCP